MTLLADIKHVSDDELAEYMMCRHIILDNFKTGIITPMMHKQMLLKLEETFGVDSNSSRGRYKSSDA